MTTKQSRRHKLLATWPRMTGPPEHMGTVGIYPYIFLAGTLIYSNLGDKIRPPKRLVPTFLENVPTGQE